MKIVLGVVELSKTPIFILILVEKTGVNIELLLQREVSEDLVSYKERYGCKLLIISSYRKWLFAWGRCVNERQI